MNKKDPRKAILVLNAGSSSLKFKLFEYQTLKEIISGIVERIGMSDSFFCYQKKKSQVKIDYPNGVANIKEALAIVLNVVLQDKTRIVGVGHRVVHGGEKFFQPLKITEAILRQLAKLSSLAPLHNPANVEGIKNSMKLLKNAPDFAVFDTGFHHTIPAKAYSYALPYRLAKKYKIRRYGFHGISHQFVAQQAAEKLKKPLNQLNLITCHLGNGCSVTAIKKGSSIETSMGFTPLEGLVMGTRSGDIDPAIPLYLVKKGMKMEAVDRILNKKSGLLGISAFSSDMRDILCAAGYPILGYQARKTTQEQRRQAKLALEVFLHRLVKYLGAYQALLGRLDAIVFTAGIGERSDILRKLLKQSLTSCLKTKFLVIPTDEEKSIARAVKKLLKK